jgi:hypothetical protein
MAKKKRDPSNDPWPLLDRTPKVGDLLFRFSFSETKFGSMVLVLRVEFVNKNGYEDSYMLKCWNLKNEKMVSLVCEKDKTQSHYRYYAIVSEL